LGQKIANPQIAKDIRSANRKSLHFRKIRNSLKKFTPQICGFEELICGPPTFDGNTPLGPVSGDFDSLHGQAMPFSSSPLEETGKGLAASGL
jgi:hypothetical protein